LILAVTVVLCWRKEGKDKSWGSDTYGRRGTGGSWRLFSHANTVAMYQVVDKLSTRVLGLIATNTYMDESD
jgi:hypothetical protein